MRVSLKGIGGNGLKMLLLSFVSITLTAGLSWLALSIWVWRQARCYPHHVDDGVALLVPGVRLKACQPGADFRARLQRAAKLWRVQRRPIAILGGHTSPNCTRSEAAAGGKYLRDCGVAQVDLLLEDQSRHSLENLCRARELFGVQDPLVIVSNRYHLPRLCLTAKRLNLNLQPCAAEETFEIGPQTIARLVLEAFYVHWYLIGLGWAHLVGDMASLHRIS